MPFTRIILSMAAMAARRRVPPRVTTRLAASALPAPVRGNTALTPDAYWAQPAAATAWGVLELDQSYFGPMPADTKVAWAYARCFFWGLEELEARALATLANSTYDRYNPSRVKSHRFLPFARPPCDLALAPEAPAWFVRADFPVAYQELALTELVALHAEYHAGRADEDALTAADAEDHQAMVELAARTRAAAQRLPARFWDPAPGQFVANARDAGAPPEEAVEEEEDDDDDDDSEDSADAEDSSEEEEDVMDTSV